MNSISSVRILQYALIAVSIVTLAACSSDSIPFSFGALEGQEVALPADWSEVGASNVIKLETNPDEPYAVNLWVIAMDDSLYVHSGDSLTTWVENLQANPKVRLGDRGEIYNLMAQRVTDPVVYARFSEIYKEKYGNYPRNRDVSEVYFIRLSAHERPPEQI